MDVIREAFGQRHLRRKPEHSHKMRNIDVGTRRSMSLFVWTTSLCLVCEVHALFTPPASTNQVSTYICIYGGLCVALRVCQCLQGLLQEAINLLISNTPPGCTPSVSSSL